MGKWGKPFVEVHKYRTADGGEVCVHHTYAYHYPNIPFWDMECCDVPDHKLLLDRQFFYEEGGTE